MFEYEESLLLIMSAKHFLASPSQMSDNMFAPSGAAILTTTIDASAGAPQGEPVVDFDALLVEYEELREISEDDDGWDGRSPPRLLTPQQRQMRRQAKDNTERVAKKIAHHVMDVLLRDWWGETYDNLVVELRELDRIADSNQHLFAARNKAFALEAYMSTRMRKHLKNIRCAVRSILSDFVRMRQGYWQADERISREIHNLVMLIHHEKKALFEHPLIESQYMPLEVWCSICECL